MLNKLTLIYWEADGMWRGKLAEYSDLFAEGESLEELADHEYSKILRGYDPA